MHAYVLTKVEASPSRLLQLTTVSRSFRKAATSDVVWEPFKKTFLEYMPSFAPFFKGVSTYEGFQRLRQIKNLDNLSVEQLEDVGYLHIDPYLRAHVTVRRMNGNIFWMETNTGRVCGVFSVCYEAVQEFMAPFWHFLDSGTRFSNKRPFNKAMSILHIQAIAERRKRRRKGSL